MPIECPEPGDLRRIREDLGLSQAELAAALGFGANGERLVRRWEAGEECDGEMFKPTPLAWAALRYLVMVVAMYRGGDRGELRRLLPECLR